MIAKLFYLQLVLLFFLLFEAHKHYDALFVTLFVTSYIRMCSPEPRCPRRGCHSPHHTFWRNRAIELTMFPNFCVPEREDGRKKSVGRYADLTVSGSKILRAYDNKIRKKQLLTHKQRSVEHVCDDDINGNGW